LVRRWAAPKGQPAQQRILRLAPRHGSAPGGKTDRAVGRGALGAVVVAALVGGWARRVVGHWFVDAAGEHVVVVREKSLSTPGLREGKGVVVRTGTVCLWLIANRWPAHAGSPPSGEAEGRHHRGHSGAGDEMAECGWARKAFYTRSARLGRQVTQHANWPLA